MNISQIALVCAFLSTALIAFDANAVDADAAKALAKQSNCLRCHGIDKKKVGPAFNEIAAKYKGVQTAEDKLIKHLGSGEMAKFPDGHEEAHMILKADPAETKNLVEWILSL